MDGAAVYVDEGECVGEVGLLISSVYGATIKTTMDKLLINDIRTILAEARQQTYIAVNTAMVHAYWLIGKRIVEEEQGGQNRATYGESVLQELSKSLSGELGRGFSYANLRNFRQFFLTYPDQEICYTLCSKLSWSHNRLIMRLESEDSRKWYLHESASVNWSVRTLERNISSFYYERILSSKVQGKEEVATEKSEKPTPADFIKDPYIFDFLNIPEPYQANERNIESALIENLQTFLLELGKGFSFVGRQFRISTETSHFYVDLVFYNYILKCFVLFDLKTGKLTHQDTGQMDMYIRMFDDLQRTEGDNPTIGIILCSEKDETVVKYSILKGHEQLFATRYRLYLPSEQELIAEIEREKMMLAQRAEGSLE